MRIALLAPGPCEQSGIADYADSFGRALYEAGMQAISPWADSPLPRSEDEIAVHMAAVDWRSFRLVHAELGGGRIGEFLALEWLSRHHPGLPLTATVHDPERLIWRPVDLPAPLATLS